LQASPELYRALLAEREAGVGMYHVLVDGDATVVGRFNLYRVVDQRLNRNRITIQTALEWRHDPAGLAHWTE
jgi:hypothetical protein